MSSPGISITQTQRLLPSRPTPERVVALSVLDATTVNFALTNAIWLFDPLPPRDNVLLLAGHLKQTLQDALNAYPQWCGRLKAVTSIDGTVPGEAQHLPPHARRYGRLYAHFGTAEDPGVELVTATSSATLDQLHSSQRTSEQPLWNRRDVPLDDFIPLTNIVNALKSDEPGPLMAVQVTELACGGFALAVKSTHPLADISALITFVKDWASVSRAVLAGDPPPELHPTFEPWRLDVCASGDIDADSPNAEIIKTADSLPLHRYDWWAPSAGTPRVPEVYKDEPPAGKPMPWSEWDVSAPVSNYIIHLTRDQVGLLYGRAMAGSSQRISRHDAILAHIWSCITRARKIQGDAPVHCDLVVGLRPALNLDKAFMGTPIIMINIEMSGSDVGGTSPEHGAALRPIAEKVRETIGKVTQPAHLGAHLHSAAFEKSPQRIWQGFLGQRHILVTTWARTGLYDLDFGFGSRVRYADGVVPLLDGNILIKEAPPVGEAASSGSWTDNGVDVSINIGQEDMERLLKDPFLLPVVEK